jgi:2-polyprenyl-3-methyl-5-hydroxy-6-metoxy-1,4-benzoquinol methylase
MSADAPPATRLPPWQTCLDIEEQAAGHYADYVSEPLLLGIDGEPGRVLELGGAAGMFGSVLKLRHPKAHVTGIEAGRAAAGVASTRLDRVICARVEDVDFAAQGIAHGEFDLVIAGDILEHLPNPWATLVSLHPLIAPGGRLLASIPNVRNLQVIEGLVVKGRFNYAERGLLDVTHLRFFAFDDIRLMFDETGYELEAFSFTLSPGLQAIYRDNKGKAQVTLDVGRMTLTGVTQRELMEFCAEQYIVRARPRR